MTDKTNKAEQAADQKGVKKALDILTLSDNKQRRLQPETTMSAACYLKEPVHAGAVWQGRGQGKAMMDRRTVPGHLI